MVNSKELNVLLLVFFVLFLRNVFVGRDFFFCRRYRELIFYFLFCFGGYVSYFGLGNGLESGEI